MAPIIDLLVGIKVGKKIGLFEWTVEVEYTFCTLKAYFIKALILTHFDPEKPSRVEVDISGRAIRGVMI